MRKRALAVGILIMTLILFASFLISKGFYNLDYVGQGHLNSVTIRDDACFTTLCEEENWQITVTDPTQLKDLESAFFNKVQDVFHFTLESGPLTFIFHYDHKDIEFHVAINKDLTQGTIYYTDRQIVYHFRKGEMSVFKELFSCKND